MHSLAQRLLRLAKGTKRTAAATLEPDRPLLAQCLATHAEDPTRTPIDLWDTLAPESWHDNGTRRRMWDESRMPKSKSLIIGMCSDPKGIMRAEDLAIEYGRRLRAMFPSEKTLPYTTFVWKTGKPYQLAGSFHFHESNNTQPNDLLAELILTAEGKPPVEDGSILSRYSLKVLKELNAAWNKLSRQQTPIDTNIPNLRETEAMLRRRNLESYERKYLPLHLQQLNSVLATFRGKTFADFKNPLEPVIELWEHTGYGFNGANGGPGKGYAEMIMPPLAIPKAPSKKKP